MTDMAGLPLSIGHNYTYELYLKTVPALSVDTHTLSRHVEIMLRGEGGSVEIFWKTRFRVSGGAVRPTQWANLLGGGGFRGPIPLGIGVAPKYRRRKWSHLKIGQNRDCGCSTTDRSRAPEY